MNKSLSGSVEEYRELTLRGMILGALITVIFTASNVYLGLKVGLTFASSIPAAVISMAVLKFFKGSNILENNMVQTQASAAGTLSTIIFVLPGLLMAGYWSGFPFWQTTLLCIAGGILGVIFTIPLRYAMVVKSDLPYPEGVAAAEILKVGGHEEGDDRQGGSGIKELAAGGALAGLMSFCAGGLRVIADSASYWFKSGTAIFQLPMGFSLALLGAGYLVGLTGGIAILLGISIAWGIAVPYFSSHIPQPSDMEMAAFAMKLWKEKVRFIGAGTIGIAAVWTLLMLLKPMVEGMKMSFKSFGGGAPATERAEQDLSPKAMIFWVLSMMFILGVSFYHFIGDSHITGGMAWLLVAVCTLLASVIGFLVAAACGYMAGLVGSSSSPISGVGIVSIVVISLVLLLVGESGGLLADEANRKFLLALTLFLRIGSNLRGFDFQRQPARLENRLPAQSYALAAASRPDYRLYRWCAGYFARVGTALRSLRLYRRNAARRHGCGAGFGSPSSDFDDDHCVGHFRPQPRMGVHLYRYRDWSGINRRRFGVEKIIRR